MSSKPQAQISQDIVVSRSALRKREIRFALLLVLPAVLIVFGLYVYPAFLTIIYSFSDVDMASLSVKSFVGLDNYTNLLSDPDFRATIVRTIYFSTMIVLVTVVVSFLIALLLNKNFKGRNILRTTILLPWAIPPVVSGVLWGQMFHAEAGTINALLYQLGLSGGNIVWLGNPKLALHIIIVAEVWRFLPFTTLFILAGMQNIPKALYDAVSMDGANTWQKFRNITLPLTMPVLLPVVIVQFTWAMKAFDSIFVLTRGMQGTTTLNYYVYKEAFEYYSLGPASAGAYILLIVMLACLFVFTYLQKKIIKGGVAK